MANNYFGSNNKIKTYKESFKHSYTRRCHSHDYRAPFIYHIILKKAPGCNNFSSIKGNARIRPGEAGCAYADLSPLGNIIQNTIRILPKDFPIVKIYQYSVMPDHVHILLRIMQRSEMHLGFYITKLKGKIKEDYSLLIGQEVTTEEIFQPNYCDKPLIKSRSLNALFRYIRENPHRLAMRQQYPQFFQRVRKLEINGKFFEAYGNLFHYRNPNKEAVKISRKITQEEKEKKRAIWFSCASKGEVLVSPFISREEKEVREEAEKIGGNIILITHECFGERYKPSGTDFDLCSAGRLLIISMGFPPKTPLTREICIQMNDLAKLISSI